MNTDVEDLLREGMERFTADLHAPAGIAAGAARRRRRRLALRSAAGAAALTGAAAAVVVTMVPGPARDAASGPPVDTAYVVKQVGSALNAAEPGDIAQMTITTTGSLYPGGKSAAITAEEWSYDNQWRAVTYSSPGHPAYDEGANASSVYTLVNYQTKTWARESGLGRPTALPVGSPTSKNGCAPAFAGLAVLFRFGLPAIGAYASATPATVAAALRSAVSCGTLDVAGHQQVDGIDAIKLTSRRGSLISETIWVSPGTYLPVRAVVHLAPGGSPGVQQTADISWLPPTARNLTLLTVPIPAGYHQVTFPQAGTPILRKLANGAPPKASALCPSPAGPACLVATSGLRGLLPAAFKFPVPLKKGAAS